MTAEAIEHLEDLKTIGYIIISLIIFFGIINS